MGRTASAPPAGGRDRRGTSESEQLAAPRGRIASEVAPVSPGHRQIHGSEPACDRPSERGFEARARLVSDHRETTCLEVGYGQCVLGPMTMGQLSAGLAAGAIPSWAWVRRVTPWLPIEYVPLLALPDGEQRRRCIEVRHQADTRGPVSLDQVRRGRAAGLIPDGSQVRVVWPWVTAEMALRSQHGSGDGRAA
jgi:hypothetical protein